MNFLTECPFCQDKLISNKPLIELLCRGKEDHTYIQQFYTEDIKEITKVICRVGSGDNRYYININFITEKTLIWNGRYNSNTKTSINKIVDIDLTKGMEDLEKKIKLLLTFS